MASDTSEVSMNYAGVICFVALGVALGGILPTSSSLASTPLEERFLACAQERDSAARLACYDRAASGEQTSARAAVPPVVLPQGSEAAGEAAPDPGVVAGDTATAPRAADPAADPAGEPISPQDRFGLPGSELARKRGMTHKESDRQMDPDRLNATVVSLSARPRGERIVTLDNGQVWVQKTPQYIAIEAGDPVTILRGALRSYRLVAAGRSTAVTRIE